MIEGIHTTWGFWPSFPSARRESWYIELRWIEVGRTIQCVGITLASAARDREAPGYTLKPRPLTSAVLKRLPIGTIIAKTRSGQAAQWDQERRMLPWRKELGTIRTIDIKRLDGEYQQRAAAWRRPGRPSRVDYARVARVYNAALDAGKPPKKAVMDKLRYPKTTADRAIAECRKRGTITAAPQAGRRQGQ